MKKLISVVFMAVASLFASAAFAVPPTTIAELTASISFADVSLGILAVAAALIGIAVTWKGAKMVLISLEAKELGRSGRARIMRGEWRIQLHRSHNNANLPFTYRKK